MSLVALHPAGQQPSALVHGGGVLVQRTLQLVEVPVRASTVQEFPSSQLLGQFPSHVSPLSRMPLPHCAAQSLSVLRLHPEGQHPSPELHWLMVLWVHSTLQLEALPERLSRVHAW